MTSFRYNGFYHKPKGSFYLFHRTSRDFIKTSTSNLEKHSKVYYNIFDASVKWQTAGWRGYGHSDDCGEASFHTTILNNT